MVFLSKLYANNSHILKCLCCNKNCHKEFDESLKKQYPTYKFSSHDIQPHPQSNFTKFIWYRRLGVICFYIFKSSILAFRRNFGFFLVTSECGAYVAVVQSLIYGSYSKMLMFLLFFSVILSLIPVLKPSFSTFSIHIFFSFTFFFFFFAPRSPRILSSTFPSLKTLFIIHF